ncbi:TetR/AcrR family transcriptional regulator [Gordonia hydrophobica]|uniref:TetR/AcrR family transcriptional regulator n=1 Tax=Gordonia hydrophobica TaxID=40516 RepID=A0ABZ2U209_9ACTN|nr:TetR/AcrR family transcriptional regulator [Gordonia hydrophobica]MBM7366704.1 AcrR family transcriptional regulator [Gordonia hydrophobica]
MSTRVSGLEYDLGASKAAARIRAAASEIFAAKGYGSTTTREIAASLDLSPGAVYPHYKTKESLLFAISIEGHRTLLDHITRVRDAHSGPTDRLRATTAAFVAWHAEHRAIAGVIQHELRSLSPEHYDLVADVRRATTKVFDDILSAGIVAGEFQVADPSIVTLALTSLGIDVSRWFPTRAHQDADDLARRYAEIVVQLAGVG